MNNLLRAQWFALIARLETLPLLWIVLTLTLLETVGESVLAVPVAIAKLGIGAGVGTVLSLSVINGLIVMAIARAARNGSVHPEDAYLGVLTIPLLASLFVHGAVIWQYPTSFWVGALVSILLLAIPLMLIRQGILTSRTVLELRQDTRTDRQSTFSLTSNGQPLAAQVCLSYARGAIHLQTSAGTVFDAPLLHFASFLLPTRFTRELRVSAYQITANGRYEGLSAFLEVNNGGETKQYDLSLTNGRLLLPLTGKMCNLKVIFIQDVDLNVGQHADRNLAQASNY
ncbi:hypothetical protein H6G00_25895 [Leptolyngbya sp. FACHB-541]|uniref:hypothetical protein n=1 Tax=Leptolyngbya sp. FACHB-541 TaxID=2692810 RepID=UPI001685C727|nr:hypothetical protein [Leptolyngbya sp. FACHB-541]MBD2000004.1 hypothetical protein [Leptolyngbya sp. FACHB-541]